MDGANAAEPRTQRIAVTSDVALGGGAAPVFVAGPCVIESEAHALTMARILADIGQRVGAAIVFKASFDKANRTSIDSFRGPGLEAGLRILSAVRDETGLPVLTDVHEVAQVSRVGEAVDVIQIPAFLCRQTDLLVAAFRTGRVVNVKKGQFLSPAEAAHVLAKAREAGSDRVTLTERGTTFGYNDLVVDMRSLPLMRAHGAPVILDVTHGLQRPGAGGGRSGGTPELALPLARAGAGAGVDGFFLEVHDDPSQALSDAATQVRPEVFERVARETLAIDAIARADERVS